MAVVTSSSEETLRTDPPAPRVPRFFAFSTALFVGVAALVGLGFNGETARIPEFCVWPFEGELRRGDCGNVLEFDDLGDRTLDSVNWDTTREEPGTAFPAVRFLGFDNGMWDVSW